jgi:hypothetical protein
MLGPMSFNPRPLAALLAVLVLGSSVGASTKFQSAWKSPDAGTVSLAGQKVAALIIDKDESLRVAGEEALARELTARGMQGVPSYRIVPKEELRNADQARGWYEKAGVQGVIALRVVSDEKRKTYSTSTWVSPYYSSFWGYYGYGWTAVYDPGYVHVDRVVSLETLIFSMAKNSLVWAGVSETDDPKEAGKVIAEVVKEAVKEMHDQGLAKAIKK